ncbi:hypothetical protein WA026_013039 [Henosepilachna vigintioctopunctata]|uniref:Uncharacterized protein n=1 Tax=Henosepilachna vigintioctopunctata TaxID=420089 RepID=A0AAW1UKX3_9CUCU
MSGRTVLSRPRTRLYNANYNIGESYYKSALDSIDRKYSGRPASTPPRISSIPRDILEKHDRAFEEEDLATSRKRAEKHITEPHMFDSRGGYLAQRALDAVENDIDEETASALTSIRANKKSSTSLDDIDLDSTFSNIKSRRIINRSEKILDTVGINGSSRKALDEEISVKRKLKVGQDTNGDLVKWKPLISEPDHGSAAAIRARETKNRLLDIEDEMANIAEKQAARDRRVARLKALVAENSIEAENNQQNLQSLSISRRREKKTVHF